MPRKPRFTLPGIPQHVIQRGNNREPCFLAEEDYRRYLEDLQTCTEKYHCRLKKKNRVREEFPLIFESAKVAPR
ncbi:transposase [Sulfuricaulis limicola]|uniref:Transposase n=1 Tax=Sulfuricaulis limicola TaxID=1620215 RepID=A0A1B4XE35_9GAMM|nr:hypothetical protein [Sulfuricaulis limicola]BAV33065.1 transposase [Sulfuricaulis limicola]